MIRNDTSLEAGAFRDREPPFSIDRSGYNPSLREKEKTNVRLDEVGTDDFLLEHGSYCVERPASGYNRWSHSSISP